MNLFLKILVGVCLTGFCLVMGAFSGCLVTIIVGYSMPNLFSSGAAQNLGSWLLIAPMVLGAIVGLVGGLFLAHRISSPPPRPPQ